MCNEKMGKNKGNVYGNRGREVFIFKDAKPDYGEEMISGGLCDGKMGKGSGHVDVNR